MLVLANSLGRYEDFFGPYLAASAAVVAFSLDTGVFRLERFGSGVRELAGAGDWACWPGRWWSLLPWVFQSDRGRRRSLVAPGVAMAVSLLNVTLELRGPIPRRPREWTAWRFVLSFVAAAAVLVLQALDLVPAWDPSWGPWLYG